MQLNNNDPIVKILCLSDIHYGFQTKDIMGVNQYLASFFKFWQNSSIEPDYILITGDIAKYGKPDEYDLFLKDILYQLIGLPNFCNSKLIVVPGNHDINRLASDNLIEQFLDNEFSEKKFSRKEFLSKHLAQFIDSFKPYSLCFEQLYNSKQSLIPDNVSAGYMKNFYHGYFVDKKHRLIFVLLNSAWFSFGPDFIKEFLAKNIELDNNILKFKEKKEWFYEIFKRIEEKKKKKKIISKNISTSYDSFSIKEINNILSKTLNTFAEEYGKQVINLEEDVFPEIKNLMSDIEKYNDYIVLLCQHHDFNWLTYKDEGLCPSASDPGNLTDLKNKTDILLAGHMHHSPKHSHDLIFENNILSLPIGSFIDDTKYTLNYDDNWFSILEINIKKRNVTNRKYHYNEAQDNFTLFKKPKPLYLPNKKHDVPVQKTRLDEIDTQLKELGDNRFLSKYLKQELVSYDNFFGKLDNTELFVFVKTLKGIDNSKQNDLLINKLINYLKDNDKIEKITFIFVDFLTKDDLYHNKIDNRMNILKSLNAELDFHFNLFRHRFFSNASPELVPSFKNLSLVCVLLPFNEVEFIINS